MEKELIRNITIAKQALITHQQKLYCQGDPLRQQWGFLDVKNYSREDEK